MILGGKLSMNLNIYRANNNLYIDVQGRVVLDFCEQLKNTAIPLIDKGISQVYVDLSAVDFIDSAGLGVLVGLKMTSNKNKARMVLVTPSNTVNDILLVSKLHSIFDIMTGSEADVLKKSIVVKENLIKTLNEEEASLRTGTPREGGVTDEVSIKKPMPAAPLSIQGKQVTPEASAPGIEPAPAQTVPQAGKTTKEQVDECCRKAVELMRQGDYEKAIEHYLEAIKIDPEFLPAYNNLAIVYEKRPSWRSKAMETWEKVLELSQSVGDQKHIDRAQKHLSNLKTSF